ncbi:transcriptional regulator with XRE-family HTH domain [Leucobacter exalbidus]|uniref:Transcriptional regulator with XRE-family HTH domain n=1 Tax=Leucobacter exalbidus TaxID=662960 RepID=A0A940T3R1_9MICO|nr:helix-turn-helix transcriptional regulator [Leucobacter exalbidus]MBP1326039.1 transcriptional regulator with XRE-family HTH domain [Leucobacter exalbidus]
MITHAALGARLREVRESKNVTQEAASAAIRVSQPTYSRIESGDRPLKGDELVILADHIGVRVASLTGYVEAGEHAKFAARTNGSAATMDVLKSKLLAYLELDSYLAEQGIPAK